MHQSAIDITDGLGKRGKYIKKIVLVLVGILLGECYSLLVSSSFNKKSDYMGCWTEKYSHHREGHCRHNGIKTKRGYLFTDTIYDHDLEKYVIDTTTFEIISTK
jgi:hypothetical protein